jgi:2,5-dihydroxypyridine 5,6-dioxygenase
MHCDRAASAQIGASAPSPIRQVKSMSGSALNPAALTTLFRREFEMCRVDRGETMILLTNLSTRREYVAAAFEAARVLGAFAYEIGLNSVPDQSRVAADALSQAEPIIAALKGCDIVCAFHAPNFTSWVREVRAAGTRVLSILDGPDELKLLLSPPGLKEAVLHAAARWEAARTVRLTSDQGTDLAWSRGEFKVKAQYGFADEDGRFDHWGAGHITNYPNEGSANGTVVIQPGDLWILPFARIVESDITLEVRDGFIRSVKGGVDAKAFRYWLDRNKRSEDDLDPYAVSHLGFGLHPNAHRDYIFHTGNDLERLTAAARVFAGNFLFSTGPNTDMGGKRDTKGHIDMPMCDCTVALDGDVVLREGRFVDPKMIVKPARMEP